MGLGVQGEVNWMKKKTAAFSPWAMVFIWVVCSGHLTLEHSGSDIILNCLRSSRGTKVELLPVSWSQGGSYLQSLEQ